MEEWRKRQTEDGTEELLILRADLIVHTEHHHQTHVSLGLAVFGFPCLGGQYTYRWTQGNP